MRNSTFWTTLLIAAGLGLVVLFLFYPDRASDMVSGVRSFINPKHADVVKLEYTAAEPARSRGWQLMRSYDSAEACLPALTRDYSRDVTIGGPIAALRCVAYRRTGELIEVVKTHQTGQ